MAQAAPNLRHFAPARAPSDFEGLQGSASASCSRDGVSTSRARPQFLLSAGFESLDALGGRQVFGHGAAEFLDGLSDFGPDLAVSAVGVGLADDGCASLTCLKSA